jgi:hypothetical protein
MQPTFSESLTFRHDDGCADDVLVSLTRAKPQYRGRLGVALCPGCKQRGFIDIDTFAQPYTVLPSSPSAGPPTG